jgi:hypothetical protein
MSDVMLLGVLRMPIAHDGGPMSPIGQLVFRAREAADRIEQDAAELERLRAENDALREVLVNVMDRLVDRHETDEAAVNARAALAQGCHK